MKMNELYRQINIHDYKRKNILTADCVDIIRYIIDLSYIYIYIYILIECFLDT